MPEATDVPAASAHGLRQLLVLRARAPVVFYTVVFLLCAEFTGVFLAPLVVSDLAYLKLYLGPHARRSTRLFLEGKDPHIISDAVTGWRQRPMVSAGKWEVDGHGSRTPHPFSEDRTKPRRILFLGSSRTNGGTAVTSGETISAYVEDANTEAINFATMVYSFDQVYLAYANGLYRYQADVLVVELSGNATSGLRNRYVPFRIRDEVDMPFLKPRFRLAGRSMELIPLPPKTDYDRILTDPAVLSSLNGSDEYYSEFLAFTRCGLTPLAGSAYWLWKRGDNLARLVFGDRRNAELLEVLADTLNREAGRHGATVVYLALPDRDNTFPSAWRRRLPDHYARELAELRAHGLRVVDTREALRQTRRAPHETYLDGLHFTPLANRVIANVVREELNLK